MKLQDIANLAVLLKQYRDEHRNTIYKAELLGADDVDVKEINSLIDILTGALSIVNEDLHYRLNDF